MPRQLLWKATEEMERKDVFEIGEFFQIIPVGFLQDSIASHFSDGGSVRDAIKELAAVLVQI